jgi:hypothetical protein
MRIVMRTCLAALAMAAAPAAAAAQTQGKLHCAEAMVGTWLATISTVKGDYASRALVSLHMGGTLTIVDSAQHQGLQGSSFSAQQGEWSCVGPDAARGITMNFGFPERESIARSHWQFAARGKTLTGLVALHIFPGIKGVDPFRIDTKPVEQFEFTAQRVGAP